MVEVDFEPPRHTVHKPNVDARPPRLVFDPDPGAGVYSATVMLYNTSQREIQVERVLITAARAVASEGLNVNATDCTPVPATERNPAIARPTAPGNACLVTVTWERAANAAPLRAELRVLWNAGPGARDNTTVAVRERATDSETPRASMSTGANGIAVLHIDGPDGTRLSTELDAAALARLAPYLARERAERRLEESDVDLARLALEATENGPVLRVQGADGRTYRLPLDMTQEEAEAMAARIAAARIVQKPDGIYVMRLTDAQGNLLAELPINEEGAIDLARLTLENTENGPALRVQGADGRTYRLPLDMTQEEAEAMAAKTAAARIVQKPDGIYVMRLTDAQGNLLAELPINEEGAIDLARLTLENTENGPALRVQGADGRTYRLPLDMTQEEAEAMAAKTAAARIVQKPDGIYVMRLTDAEDNLLAELPLDERLAANLTAPQPKSLDPDHIAFDDTGFVYTDPRTGRAVRVELPDTVAKRLLDTPPAGLQITRDPHTGETVLIIGHEDGSTERVVLDDKGARALFDLVSAEPRSIDPDTLRQSGITVQDPQFAQALTDPALARTLAFGRDPQTGQAWLQIEGPQGQTLYHLLNDAEATLLEDLIGILTEDPSAENPPAPARRTRAPRRRRQPLPRMDRRQRQPPAHRTLSKRRRHRDPRRRDLRSKRRPEQNAEHGPRHRPNAPGRSHGRRRRRAAPRQGRPPRTPDRGHLLRRRRRADPRIHRTTRRPHRSAPQPPRTHRPQLPRDRARPPLGRVEPTRRPAQHHRVGHAHDRHHPGNHRRTLSVHRNRGARTRRALRPRLEHRPEQGRQDIAGAPCPSPRATETTRAQATSRAACWRAEHGSRWPGTSWSAPTAPGGGSPST